MKRISKEMRGIITLRVYSDYFEDVKFEDEITPDEAREYVWDAIRRDYPDTEFLIELKKNKGADWEEISNRVNKSLK